MLQQLVVVFCRTAGRITNLDIYVVIKIFHCIIGVVLNKAYWYLMYRLLSLFWACFQMTGNTQNSHRNWGSAAQGFFCLCLCHFSPVMRAKREQVGGWGGSSVSVLMSLLGMGSSVPRKALSCNLRFVVRQLWRSGGQSFCSSRYKMIHYHSVCLAWKSQMRYMWK